MHNYSISLHDSCRHLVNITEQQIFFSASGFLLVILDLTGTEDLTNLSLLPPPNGVHVLANVLQEPL